jgi:hypothetical protein
VVHSGVSAMGLEDRLFINEKKSALKVWPYNATFLSLKAPSSLFALHSQNYNSINSGRG